MRKKKLRARSLSAKGGCKYFPAPKAPARGRLPHAEKPGILNAANPANPMRFKEPFAR